MIQKINWWNIIWGGCWRGNEEHFTSEHKIEKMVLKLYDLAYAEMLVVCPDFWLSEERYGEVEM